MTPDPNADLIGYEFPGDRGPLKVTGTAPWSKDGHYVTVEHAGNGAVQFSCRPAHLIRKAKDGRSPL